MSAPVAGRLFDAGPSDRIGDVLGLHDELAELAQAGDRLRRRVEDVTGLRRGELEALAAVAAGAADAPALAAATGQVDDAALATAATLVERGLVRAGGSSTSGLRVTEAGRVVLQQDQALQIRVLDAVVERLGIDRAGDLRTGVRALGSALRLEPAAIRSTHP